MEEHLLFIVLTDPKGYVFYENMELTAVGFVKESHYEFPKKKCIAIDLLPSTFFSVGFLTKDPHRNQINIHWQKKIIPNKCVIFLGTIQNKLDVLNQIHQSILDSVPLPIFWKDLNHRILGCNRVYANNAGYKHPKDLIGKTDHDLPWHECADKYKNDDIAVVSNRSNFSFEEENVQCDGSKRYVLVSKSPLYNHDEIIGVVGSYIDITDRKRRELLELDKLKAERHAEDIKKEALADKQSATLKLQYQENLVKEQQQFSKIVHQAAHDIRSPLSSLLMITKICTDIPEAPRTTLREVAASIGKIADHLLSHYKKNTEKAVSDDENSTELLVSGAVLEIISEKKYEYQEKSVHFDFDFSKDAYFSFIQIPSMSFRRMLSNVMNNAVDACEGRERGEVLISLTADGAALQITVSDNGKGIPSSVLERILNKTVISSGKEKGHGLGLMQVREALLEAHGFMNITSMVGKGTDIHLIFPRRPTPAWIAQNLCLHEDDIVVILDDDVSIHTAWDTRFASILQTFPLMRVHHFELAEAAVAFIQALRGAERKRVFLLTDFELLKQSMNGLDVVAQTVVTRAVLVTSYYADPEIRARAAGLQTLVLPKQLASDVALRVEKG